MARHLVLDHLEPLNDETLEFPGLGLDKLDRDQTSFGRNRNGDVEVVFPAILDSKLLGSTRMTEYKV